MAESGETSALLERLMQAIGSRDSEAAAALVAPDCELKSLLGQVEGGTYRGPQGVREWYRDVIEAFDPFDPGFTGSEVLGDGAIATGHARGRARSSGLELDWDWTALVRSRQGLVTRFAIYPTRQELDRGEDLTEVGT